MFDDEIDDDYNDFDDFDDDFDDEDDNDFDFDGGGTPMPLAA